MRRNPTYVFKDANETGIYDIPVESIIHVIDADGSGTPSITQLVNKSQLGTTSTIGQYLSTPGAFKPLDKFIEKFNDIGDVNLTGLLTEQVLTFDGTQWVNSDPKDIAQNIKIEDISNINASSPADKQILHWDAINNTWFAADLDGGTF
jgi:hypothetical protein